MVERRSDCRHLTVVGLHDTGPSRTLKLLEIVSQPTEGTEAAPESVKQFLVENVG